MAVSDKQALTATGALVIKEALQLLGVLAEGEDPSATTTADCLRTLNYMIKSWQGKHMGNLWTAERILFFPTTNQHENLFQYSSNMSIMSDFNVTHVATDTSSGTDTIPVDVTGYAPVDGTTKVGIETTTGIVEWFTAGTGSTTTSFVVDSNIAADTTAGNVVYYFAPLASTWMPPPFISSANWAGAPLQGSTGISTTNPYDNVFNTEIPMTRMTRNDYNSLTNKATVGRPLNFHYERLDAAVNKLYLWPAPQNGKDPIILWGHKSIDILDANTQDLEYPQEFFLALAYNLALYLSPKFGVDEDRMQFISAMSMQLLKEAEAFDTEMEMSIEPDYQDVM